MYCGVIVILLFAALSVSAVDVEDFQEGSGDICNYEEGSTCPSNRCCREEICQHTNLDGSGNGLDGSGNGFKCCDSPEENPLECANCPKCGM